MTAKKQIAAYAKSLLKLCFVGEEFSEERALAVLQTLEKNPPRHYAAVLKAFHRLVQRELANRTADVEFAGQLSESALDAIRSNLSASYGRSIAVRARSNDALIAGIRVRVGCDLYDASVAGALTQLQRSLS